MSILRLLVLVSALLPVLAGCVTVQLNAAGGEATVVRHVGWLQVQVSQPEQAVVGRVHGLGLVATPMGVSAGYTRQRWAALGPGCRAVLWAEDGTVIGESTRRMLEQTAGVCLVSGEGTPVIAEAEHRRKE